MRDILSIIFIGVISMVLGAIRPVKVYVENIKTPTESNIDSLRKESKRLTDSITMDIETFKMELDAVESEVIKIITQIDTVKIQNDTVSLQPDTVAKKKSGWFKKITNKIKGKKDE